ncbi:hypothetical protein AYI70_g179 [Smittium culicis]|uniref:Myb-like domain-containing protein n=1 Tax=Smittium culicis TaxID=133412 RepID=A0A1R1YHN5_9FUNG|nr:hypothetical protein AYI70_g10697 [Smittium culicis]OMJ26432.1 hypothetical protein AYI70_g179 [Smittium culicis]
MLNSELTKIVKPSNENYLESNSISQSPKKRKISKKRIPLYTNHLEPSSSQSTLPGDEFDLIQSPKKIKKSRLKLIEAEKPHHFEPISTKKKKRKKSPISNSSNKTNLNLSITNKSNNPSENLSLDFSSQGPTQIAPEHIDNVIKPSLSSNTPFAENSAENSQLPYIQRLNSFNDIFDSDNISLDINYIPRNFNLLEGQSKRKSQALLSSFADNFSGTTIGEEFGDDSTTSRFACDLYSSSSVEPSSSSGNANSQSSRIFPSPFISNKEASYYELKQKFLEKSKQSSDFGKDSTLLSPIIKLNAYSKSKLVSTAQSMIDKAINTIKKTPRNFFQNKSSQLKLPNPPIRHGSLQHNKLYSSSYQLPTFPNPPTKILIKNLSKNLSNFEKRKILNNIESLDDYGGNLPFKTSDFFRPIDFSKERLASEHQICSEQLSTQQPLDKKLLDDSFDQSTSNDLITKNRSELCKEQAKIYQNSSNLIPEKRKEEVKFAKGHQEITELLENKLLDRFGSLMPKKLTPTSLEKPVGTAKILFNGKSLNDYYDYEEVTKKDCRKLIALLENTSQLTELVPKELLIFLNIRVPYSKDKLHTGMWADWENIILIIAFNAILHSTTLKKRTLIEFMYFKKTTKQKPVGVMPKLTVLFKDFLPHRSQISIDRKIKNFFFPLSRSGNYDDSDDATLIQGLKNGLTVTNVSIMLGRTLSQIYYRLNLLNSKDKNRGEWSIEEKRQLKFALDKYCKKPITSHRAKFPSLLVSLIVTTRSKEDILRYYYDNVMPNLGSWDPEKDQISDYNAQIQKLMKPDNNFWNRSNFLLCTRFIRKKNIDYIHNLDWDSVESVFGNTCIRNDFFSKFKNTVLNIQNYKSIKLVDVLLLAEKQVKF